MEKSNFMRIYMKEWIFYPTVTIWYENTIIILGGEIVKVMGLIKLILKTVNTSRHYSLIHEDDIYQHSGHEVSQEKFQLKQWSIYQKS